eukprot:TRINITY_DN11524_c0_g1_i5.p1 TRINITY_DN11524_c0_g1~~TRINITY_DN11524_c0_g1_i5.p1  ORF type:complete len:107 (+),score=17.03 TRINITY_DN11524_c0_g1_i5:153-473(+)
MSSQRRELQLPKQIDTLSIVVYKVTTRHCAADFHQYLREWGEIAKDYDLNNYELDPSLVRCLRLVPDFWNQEDVPHTLENGKASVKRWAEEIQAGSLESHGLRCCC